MVSGSIASQVASQTSTSYYADTILDGTSRKDPKAIGGLFEAMIFRIILRQMREGELEKPLLDGADMEVVREMRDDELAQHLGSLGQLGISDLIAREIEDAEKSPSLSTPPLGLLKNP